MFGDVCKVCIFVRDRAVRSCSKSMEDIGHTQVFVNRIVTLGTPCIRINDFEEKESRELQATDLWISITGITV